MAANFRILCRKNKGSLHLNLAGDFDGSSAHELINTLEERADDVVRVFIHTNNLKTIHPFGRAVLRNMLPTSDRKACKLVFTGEKGEHIAH